MRLRPLLVAVLVVAGIVAAFIVGEKQLRVRFGFAEGPNGVSVEQADGPEGRIVAIRSRFLDETAHYSPEGKLLARDLKATLREDAKKVVTFSVLFAGEKVVGTERYEFDKRALRRTWTRYNARGASLYVREETLGDGRIVWRLADGTVTTPAGARAAAEADQTAIEIGPGASASGLCGMPNGVIVEWDGPIDNAPPDGPVVSARWSIQSHYVRENAMLTKGGAPLCRDLIAILRDDDRHLVTFEVNIVRNKVASTVLTEADKKGISKRQVFDASGELLFVEQVAPNGKTVCVDPQGKPLTRKESGDLYTDAVDEEGIEIPVPHAIKP